MVTSPNTDDAYERGHLAGMVAARLAGHDEHLAKINGSIDRLSVEMRMLVTAVQRLSDQVEASAHEAGIAVAAIKNQSERSWMPIQRMIAVIGGVAAVVAITIGIVSVFF